MSNSIVTADGVSMASEETAMAYAIDAVEGRGAATRVPSVHRPTTPPPAVPGLTEAQRIGQTVLDTLRAVERVLMAHEYVVDPETEETLPGVWFELLARVDGRLTVDETVLLAQAVHHVAYYLTSVVKALHTVRADNGTEEHPDGAPSAESAAVALQEWTERMMRDLDERRRAATDDNCPAELTGDPGLSQK